jgi:hypothetical protein
MSDERVLLTDEKTPIYHNPNPTDSYSIEFKQRWKGYCLFEYYETREANSLWENQIGLGGKELSRYVVVWDGAKPIAIVDGIWTEHQIVGYGNEEAVLAPGTTDMVREAFREWIKKNPSNHFGVDSLNIDQKVVIEPIDGTIEDAKQEMATLFDSFFMEQGTSHK